jgi:hypothetical protein
MLPDVQRQRSRGQLGGREPRRPGSAVYPAVDAAAVSGMEQELAPVRAHALVPVDVRTRVDPEGDAEYRHLAGRPRHPCCIASGKIEGAADAPRRPRSSAHGRVVIVAGRVGRRGARGLVEGPPSQECPRPREVHLRARGDGVGGRREVEHAAHRERVRRQFGEGRCREDDHVRVRRERRSRHRRAVVERVVRGRLGARGLERLAEHDSDLRGALGARRHEYRRG